MRAINHALTGAIIGLTVSDPIVAVPVALVSHFALDAIPHHGESVDDKDKPKWIRSKTFRLMIYMDAFLCGVLVLVLAASRPLHWFTAAICAFAAASPDFMSINLYKRVLAGQGAETRGLYGAFASRIQWFERPIGAVVEVTWFAGALVVLAAIVR